MIIVSQMLRLLESGSYIPLVSLFSLSTAVLSHFIPVISLWLNVWKRSREAMVNGPHVGRSQVSIFLYVHSFFI